MDTLIKTPALTRRGLMIGAGGLGLATGLGLWRHAAATAETAGDFPQPPELSSSGGALTVTITVDFATYTLNGKPVTLRSYNGGYCGPTLRLKAGDTLNLLLVNQLPPNPEICSVNPSLPHSTHGATPLCFNTTNMHVHGVHVSPKTPADNVLEVVEPGQSRQYVYRIPEDHPPGTYFYHAHQHGSVALQVASGMAGALIIEAKDPAHNPWPAHSVERTLMITSQCVDDQGRCDDFPTVDINGPTFINGQVNPTLTLPFGQPQIWHLVNATHNRFLRLRLDGCSIDLLTCDGNPLDKPERVETILLAPGNRVDVRVASTGIGENRFKLVNTGWPGWELPPKDTVLMTVYEPGHLAGERAAAAAPAVSAPAILRPRETLRPDQAKVGRKVTFGMIGTQPSWTFTVDGRSFDTTHTMVARLNDIELWEIINQTGDPHPFHIHVNPVQVLDVSDNSIPPGRWLDTVVVPVAGRLRFLTQFKDYTGLFVFHCHTLVHEDLGMMQLIEVV